MRVLSLRGNPDFAWQLPANEWDAISLNYTSGTTGKPKGAVYHHRGAYLNAIGDIGLEYASGPGLFVDPSHVSL